MSYLSLYKVQKIVNEGRTKGESTEGMSKNQIIRMEKKEERLAQQKDERKNMTKVAPSKLPAEMKSLRDEWIAAYKAKEFKGQ